MSLSPGTRIGQYEVTALIGAGGMGEVYRATDTRLKRAVALKVLPAAVAADAGRVARFQREAEVLAALNHPHIANIYGLEETDGVKALVMELVEGPTLAELIEGSRLRAQGAGLKAQGSGLRAQGSGLEAPASATAGQGLPVGEALTIARQIAEALEAAHEHGIIHRDLKPANIKVRDDGTVKVLDFGLAKALGVDGGPPPDIRGPGPLSQSPTITSPALLTSAGVILGTAAYMSPEQAKGKAADRRADIWAFGCVLYEMLTGRRAFPGDEVAEVLAAVIQSEPDWGALPPLPAVARRFLVRCLQKTPAERVRDAGDLRLALAGVFEPEGGVTPVSTPARSRWPWIAAGAVGAAIAVGLLGWSVRPVAARPVVRFAHVLPPDQPLTQTVRPLIAIAPDGSSIVYVASNRLFRRAMNDPVPVPIRGTDGMPSTPFFSPDGQSVGYWDSRAEQIRAVAVAGGTPVTVAAARSFYGAMWAADDTVLFGQEDGIWRVDARGGTPRRLVQIEPGERVHGPQLLPDGRRILFTLIALGSMVGNSTAWDTGRILIQSLETGERTVVVSGSDARYLPTGHLVYALGTTLLAAPMDLATGQLTGRARPLVDEVQRAVRTGGSSGSANYDFSRDGTLVYVQRDPGAVVGEERRLVAVDMAGNTRAILDEPRNYWRPRISPDGSRILVEVDPASASTAQLWMIDIESKAASPFTQQDEESTFPAWMPDGRSVVYRSNRGGRIGLYRQAADGSGDPELLLETPAEAVPSDVSRDGTLVFAAGPQTGERSIRTLQVDRQEVADFLATDAWEHMAVFSPDGRWIAYSSNESGAFEVYVRPFPRAAGIARRVSADGGNGPVWAPDGRTLYYRGASGNLMAVPVTLAPAFGAGRPRALFRIDDVFRMSGNTAAYDITPDGTRFVMVAEPADVTPTPRQLNVVTNWFDELRRQVPVE